MRSKKLSYLHQTDLSRFPRISLGHFATPIEEMPNLTKLLAGPKLWIKRDDCTGLSTGGNKTRKLEFLMADALEQKADTIITQGATQSNHARQTAAAAAKLGLECHILLEDRTGYEDHSYIYNGNVLLDRLHGATVSKRPKDADMQAEMEKFAVKLKEKGRKPYIIPGGGSNRIGALGYVNCVDEILMQSEEIGVNFDCIVLATGSSGTHAGLVAGMAVLKKQIPILGIGVRAPKELQETNVFNLAQKTSEYIGYKDLVKREMVVANCDYVGPGYGLPTSSMIEAVKLLAEKEGILLDPVYSGKGMAGLIDLIRKKYFKADDNVLFLHTGGAAALFGYPQTFELPGYQSSNN